MIADAAFQLFLNNPFESVSVDSIAGHSEISKGTFYYYFKSKEELLGYVICRGLEQLSSKIQEQCVSLDNLHEALDVLIELQYHYYRSYHQLVIFLLRRQDSDSIADDFLTSIKKNYRIKQELIAGIIKRAMDTGYIIKGDEYQITRGIENTIKGFSLGDMENRHSEEQGRDLELIKRIIFDGLLI